MEKEEYKIQIEVVFNSNLCRKMDEELPRPATIATIIAQLSYGSLLLFARLNYNK
jgi:hypothetical protein